MNRMIFQIYIGEKMNDQLTFWLLGCAYGVLSGWLITWSYYTHKIRMIRIEKWIEKNMKGKNE